MTDNNHKKIQKYFDKFQKSLQNEATEELRQS